VTPTATSVSVGLGALLAIVGGFLDAYTYVSRDGVFANSQTGNLVLFGVEAARGNWANAVRHVPPIIAFIVGVVAAETLKRPRVARVIRRPARVALFLEIVVLLLVGALPQSTPSSIVTVTIAFVASVQVSTFRTLVKWPYNNTMATGNLRTAVQSLYLAFADRDPDAGAQARAFSAVIVCFLVGALGRPAHFSLRRPRRVDRRRPARHRHRALRDRRAQRSAKPIHCELRRALSGNLEPAVLIGEALAGARPRTSRFAVRRGRRSPACRNVPAGLRTPRAGCRAP
jgi:uncharacterized membrane protein YoaK (UPF0700 family)